MSDYQDNSFNNHDRSSWLRDNFMRGMYDTPLAQKRPNFFNTRVEGTKKLPNLLSEQSQKLFPAHEAFSGKTCFGTIAPSRLTKSSKPQASIDWIKLAKPSC